MNKRIVAVVAMIFVGGGIFAYRSYVGNQAVITIRSDTPGAKISLVKSNGGEIKDLSENTVAGPIGSNLTKKVKKGTYVYHVEAGDSYAAVVEPIDITGNTIKKVSLPYSDKHLKSLASQARPVITQDLSTTFSDVMKDFVVGDIKAFGDGSWYGVRINPRNPTGDTFICVYHETADGQLKLATPSPNLTLAGPVYPDIPRDVLIDTNNMVRDIL